MKDDPASLVLPYLEIYTDGGCEPNPGPGGYGAILVHPKKRAEVSGGFRKTTNNRMEIFAAIAGLDGQWRPAGFNLTCKNIRTLEFSCGRWSIRQPMRCAA